MARVKLHEPCVWEEVRYEKGDVIDVPDSTAELNSGWMKPTTEAVTVKTKQAGKKGEE